MKIMIAGNGKVGTTLARELAAEGYDITLIDSDHAVLEEMMEKMDVIAVQGNCASMEILKQAGVDEADLLIAVTNADEVNLLCCTTAHAMNPNLHTIARIRTPEYASQAYALRDVFGLSLVINPELQTAREVDHLLSLPGFLKRDIFVRGRVEIVELLVDETSKLKDVPLSRLNGIVKCQVLICAVLRNQSALIPSGDFVLRQGDRIFVTAPTANLATLLDNLDIITRKVRRVMICGGGRVSHYLAQRLLGAGVEVQIIESDLQRCNALSAALPEANVVYGDASDQDLLRRLGVQRSDALVTLTGMDELNMVISLYGHSLGVPQIITKLGRMENNGLLDGLPLGSVVSPRELCTGIILHYVRALQNQVGAAVSVHPIANNLVEASEFVVDDTTAHCGQELKDIRLRKDVLIACISRGARTIIPNGRSSFQKGDRLVVITPGDHVVHQLNEIFA